LARDAILKKEDGPLPEGTIGTLKERRESAVKREEQHYLQELMALTEGDIRRACEISGLSRVRLHVLLKKHSIKRK
jgi:two-component system NtrC family response regulator